MRVLTCFNVNMCVVSLLDIYPFLSCDAYDSLKNRFLVSAADLSDEFKAELRGTVASIATQVKANAVVDEVILSETIDIVDTRVEQSEVYLQDIGRSLEDQSTLLHQGALRMCAYYKCLATTVKAHVDNDQHIDYGTADELDSHEYGALLSLMEYEILTSLCLCVSGASKRSF